MSSESLEQCERELRVILRELQSEISYQTPSKYGGKHGAENFLSKFILQFVRDIHAPKDDRRRTVQQLKQKLDRAESLVSANYDIIVLFYLSMVCPICSCVTCNWRCVWPLKVFRMRFSTG